MSDATAEPGRVSEQALLRCADEPIAIPGTVQPHGALVAVTETDLAVVVASANAAEFFGRPVAGSSLDALLDEADTARLRTGLAGDLAEVNPLRVQLAGAEVDLVLHRADGLLLTEWERVQGTEQAGAAWHRRLPTVLQRLSAAATLDELTEVLARDVRALTGFDRVMVYRFDPEWNGEVIAEDRRGDLEPFLGLRYPASDIPAQARALYATNWMRLIPDATYRPVPLEPVLTPHTGRPLDLSGAMLRSVSPVHLEYLANMGVIASMSISLIDRGRLWGLISCHHYRGPHRPSYTDRTAAEFLGRTASVLLHTKVTVGEQSGIVQVAQRQAQLAAVVGRAPRELANSLTEGEVTALDLLPAAGAAVRINGQLRLLGTTPPAARIAPLVRALLAAGTPVTDAVSRVVPDAADLADTASGVLAVGTDDFLAWFRPETVREVTWGGNPYLSKTTETDAGPRLNPRRSFAGWSETVHQTSRPWREHEVAAARSLATDLADAVLTRAGEDNRLATAPQRMLLLEELRHALRAHLLRAAGPAAALDGLNEVIGALLPGEMATAVVVELDPATGEVVVANAGHLPVLHATSAGAAYLDEGRGPALGLLDEAGYRETRVQLEGHDRLLLYSDDGLVERGRGGLGGGLDELRVAVGSGPTDPHALLDAVLDALDPPRTDDVTLLGIART